MQWSWERKSGKGERLWELGKSIRLWELGKSIRKSGKRCQGHHLENDWALFWLPISEHSIPASPSLTPYLFRSHSARPRLEVKGGGKGMFILNAPLWTLYSFDERSADVLSYQIATTTINKEECVGAVCEKQLPRGPGFA